jgi:hypothetical protein
MRDENVDLTALSGWLHSDPKLQAEDSPPHLCLRVLVGTRLVPKRASQPGNTNAARLDDSTVNVVASLRSEDGNLRLKR